MVRINILSKDLIFIIYMKIYKEFEGKLRIRIGIWLT